MSHPVPAVSHVQEVLEEFLPALRPAQQRGLAEWVTGVLAADSGGESAVLAALAREGLETQAARARLREVLCDGAERAAPCATSLDVEACFAPLLAWVVSWWAGDTLPISHRCHQLARPRSGLEHRRAPSQSRYPRGLGGAAASGQRGLDAPLVRLLGLLAPAVPDGMRGPWR